MGRSVKWQWHLICKGLGILVNDGDGEAQNVKLKRISGVRVKLPAPPNPWPAGHQESIQWSPTFQDPLAAFQVLWTEESGGQHEQEIRFR